MVEVSEHAPVQVARRQRKERDLDAGAREAGLQHLRHDWKTAIERVGERECEATRMARLCQELARGFGVAPVARRHVAVGTRHETGPAAGHCLVQRTRYAGTRHDLHDGGAVDGKGDRAAHLELLERPGVVGSQVVDQEIDERPIDVPRGRQPDRGIIDGQHRPHGRPAERFHAEVGGTRLDLQFLKLGVHAKADPDAIDVGRPQRIGGRVPRRIALHQ